MAENESSSRNERVNAVIGEYIRAGERGETPDRKIILEQNPDIAAELESFLDNEFYFRQFAAGVGSGSIAANPSISGSAEQPASDPNQPTFRFQNQEMFFAENTENPARIGRYRVENILGEGGFGLVYLAYDEQLSRPVAIKVPHQNLVSNSEDAKAYLTEARTVANLDHPNIVPVYDIGSTSDFPVFVVSKYVEGMDLATRLKKSRPSLQESVNLVATVADALHYAHMQGIVHRDVKSGNILIDKQGRPFVVDFGLALREENIGKGAKCLGTPAYMSPEQARGEGHRVDGRSDIFSLGVVFYELLTGTRPFKADSQAELLEQITSVEVRPPRQVDDAVPKELERICLKSLSKRASERYTTATDLAEDLRHFIVEQPVAGISSSSNTPVLHPSSTLAGSGQSATPNAPISDSQPIRIVPKGLRSFDARDSDFFLELLPGPRDRDGLPDSLRFWKARIEASDADATFSVGLIYGPSGCGKSSMVKAGLLPRLSDDVIVVYVEASADETEACLLNGLRRRIPALPDHLGLREALAALRRRQGVPNKKKVLIVLDQFEQWLHAKTAQEHSELVQALRHCDGEHLQCIVMVRDDFWLAVSRFLQNLEVRLVEGHNSALVDLFDTDHARKVLSAFGRAFGKLPENPGDTTKGQKEFLDKVVSGLAADGKVICVRLSLFAEMMKGKVWTPATLKQVGGTEGFGITFLEETLSASTAPPEHRYHEKAARAILKALLPETGSDIKGHMRSYADLLRASGYGKRPKDFDDLVRILDSELRLITPTDPEGKSSDTELVTQAAAGQKYFQLTHDYLVHSLREWLARKQKETRRGRAELLLADRAGVWTTRLENRQLPSFLQWIRIHCLTLKKHWTLPQRKMMAKADRYHVTRGIMIIVLLSLIGWSAYEGNGRLQAVALQGRLLDANTTEVPSIVKEMTPYRGWLNPLLREARSEVKTKKDFRKQLHASLALLPVDATQVDYLYDRLLDAEPHEVPLIRDALAPHKDQLLTNLWSAVGKPAKGKEPQRLRAAAALAKFDAESQRWGQSGNDVVNGLFLENPFFLLQWTEALRPVKTWLIPRLTEIFRDHDPEHTEERTLAARFLSDYASDQPHLLADLVLDADEKQFAIIYPLLKNHREQVLQVFIAEIDKKLPDEVPSSDESREQLAKRQTNAAVTLLRMNQQERFWPLLKHSPDPRVRTRLIHRMSSLGVDAELIIKQLEEEPDITIRRALLFCLGEFRETEFSLENRNALLPKLQEDYQTAADPGIHAALEWLLRTWNKQAWLEQINDGWMKNNDERKARIARIKDSFAKNPEKTSPKWYVNCQGQTMVVVPGPVEIGMGSPLTEANRKNDENQHHKRISRTFAIGSKLVTKDQFFRFWPNFHMIIEMHRFPEPTCPVGSVSSFSAAAYCNWLSKEEGIPEDQWCYQITSETSLKENYLSLVGYRLPTEAEMEYSIRAGALTCRYFGESDEFLSKYEWYGNNSKERTWPVGSLKPNDLGLFDVTGSVMAWCQDNYKRYDSGDTSEDTEGTQIISNEMCILRGGSFSNPPSFLRSASRTGMSPTSHFTDIGFRPARTLSLVDVKD